MQETKLSKSAVSAAGSLLGGIFVLSMSPSPAYAACTEIAGYVLECQPPAVVDRDHSFTDYSSPGSVHTVDIQGTVGLPTLITVPEGLSFTKDAAFEQKLTLLMSGHVDVSAIAPVTDLIRVENFDGLNDVVIGSNVRITADDSRVAGQPWTAIANISHGNSRNFGNSSKSYTEFDGTLDIQSPTERVQGVVTRIDAFASSGLAEVVLGSNANINIVGGSISGNDRTIGVAAYGYEGRNVNANIAARAVLLAGSQLTVTGEGARGVYVEAEGQDAAVLESAGTITMNGVSGGIRSATGLFAQSRLDGDVRIGVTGGSVILRSNGATSGDSWGVLGETFGGGELSVLVNGGAVVDVEESTGIGAYVEDGALSVNTELGSVITSGDASTAIFANAFGLGTVNVVSGLITTSGEGSIGIDASAAQGAVSVNSTAGALTTSGDSASGIVAAGAGPGAVSVTSGPISTNGFQARGIEATSSQGTVAVNSTAGLIATQGNESAGVRLRTTDSDSFGIVTGNITTAGSDSHGIDASGARGTASVDTRAGTIVTTGGASNAVLVEVTDGITTGTADSLSVFTGGLQTSGADAYGLMVRQRVGNRIVVDTTAGAITTQGARAHGFWLETDGADAQLTVGDIQTSGAAADGVLMRSGRSTMSALFNGNIVATGAGSRGVAAYQFNAVSGTEGTITLQVDGSVSASGDDGVAMFATSNFAAVDLNIAATGIVSGGWDLDAATLSAASGVNGAAIVASAPTGFSVDLVNAGQISSRSDRAFTAATGSSSWNVTNSGNVTGFWDLSAAADAVVNSGVIEARHFADTNGDGTRDTKRIATLAFGAGDDVLRNEAGGTIRLGRAAAATAVESQNQYLPDLMPVAGFTTATAGVEQAHFVQLERFENRGTITLRDVDAGGLNGIAGDVLLLTSGTVSNTGVLTPGASPMVFLSDGGTLALDTELNQGGAASHSDMLVVDSVQLGANGATRVLITNAGGMGAATTGSGIKLVDVLAGGNLSAANAFVLGAPVVAGAFTYNLFQSAPLGTDGDWYLRTAPAVNPPDPPVTPPVTPPTTPDPPVVPPVTYRPEAALFAAMPGFLRNIDAAIPGSRAARLGDEADGLATARRGRVWARYISEDIDTTQTGTVSPAVDGEANGYQFGVELFGGKDEAAAQVGLYAGRVEGTAAVSGFANGIAGAPVGRLEPEVTYAGVYVSRSRGRGLYFDTVLQYGFYGGEALTYADGEVAKIKGTGGYASLELGYGLAIHPSIVIEPQFQVVAQPQRVHEVTIVNAQVRQDPANTVAGRGGLRVKGDFGSGAWRFQPYIGASLWKGLDHSDRTRFSGNGSTQTTLDTASELNALEFVGGLSLGMGSRLTAIAQYAKLSARGDAGMARDGTAISAGLRFAW